MIAALRERRWFRYQWWPCACWFIMPGVVVRSYPRMGGEYWSLELRWEMPKFASRILTKIRDRKEDGDIIF